MTNQEPINSNQNASTPNELQSFKSAFIIPNSYKCIICRDNILNVGEKYDLINFLDKGEINVKRVTFLNAYLRSDRLTIVALDLKKGKLITRNNRIDIELPCDWVLIDTDVFEPKLYSEKREIDDYYVKK